MTATSFRLEVVTPERVVFDGSVTSVVFPAVDGLVGVLPNHAPLLAAVDIGPLKVVEEGARQERYLFVSDGFFEVAENHARVLADAGERAEDIDARRAHEAEERARKRLKEAAARPVDFDQIRAERALQRALWRQVLGKRNLT